MRKDEYRKVLIAKLEAEKKAGFRHCVVMLEELLDLYDGGNKASKYKQKRCDVCGELFNPASGSQKTCQKCKEDVDELVDDLFGGK